MLQRYFLAALLAAALLPACGFHLRGSGSTTANIQAEKVFVSAGTESRVGRELRSQLRLAGVTVPRMRKDAEYVVRVSDERLERDVLSVHPRTGKAEEYELTLGVTVTIIGPDRKEILSGERITLVRDFTYDQDAALGKFSEEELLIGELTRETVDQILRRLSAAIEKTSP
jgi:LPS-assembly lipoprotein